MELKAPMKRDYSYLIFTHDDRVDALCEVLGAGDSTHTILDVGNTHQTVVLLSAEPGILAALETAGFTLIPWQSGT